MYHARGTNLPIAWEEAVTATLTRGVAVCTEYDRDGDPPSLDLAMAIEVSDPLSEPRIHRWFPASLETLEEYRQEVVDGIHDHYVDEGRWPYSYHKRLIAYPCVLDAGDDLHQYPFDQIMYGIINKLREVPYTRRAQAITWIPEKDPYSEHPPCLQRVFCRVMKGKLDMHTHWRSRDAFKAAFMNMYALTSLQRWIAKCLGLDVGQYLDISDSFHVYGKDRKELKKLIARSGDFEDRVWYTEGVEQHLRGDDASS